MSEPGTAQPLAELEAEIGRLKRAVEELSTLNAISSAISSTLSLNEVVEMIVQESVRAINVEQGAVMLLRQDGDADPFRTMVRKNDTGSNIVPFRFGQQLTGWMLKHQKPLVINDLANDPRFGILAGEDLQIRSLLSVPLRAKGQMVGLLNIFNKRTADGFTRDDQRLLTIIASQSAQIVESARLYEELQRRSNELLDSERKYRALIAEAGAAILLADFKSRRVIEANEMASSLLGAGAGLRGLSLKRVLPVEDFGEDEAIKRLEAEGNLRFSSVPVSRKSQEELYIDIGATLISIGGNRIVQVICHDVTERVKLSQHLRVHAEELEREVDERTRDLRASQARLVQQEKMAALGRLVAGVAHEMNTPIGTITSNADTLERSLTKMRGILTSEDMPAEVTNHRMLNKVLGLVEEIARVNRLASDRIVGIVSSLRNFARLDESELKEADLHEGLDSTLTLVHHELKNRITVLKEYGEIPAIKCHPNQINQVFMNLLVNASQAIDGEGDIRIRSWRDGKMVNVQITDSGVGIPQDNLDRIFDPGFTTKGVGVGTGLGLSICFKIAQDHGGNIDVTSKVGEGSAFTLSLPVSRDDEDGQDA